RGAGLGHADKREPARTRSDASVRAGRPVRPVRSTAPVSDGPSAPRWARAAAVLLGAALYALSLPPWDWACLGWVALVPLLLIVRGRRPRRAVGVCALQRVARSWLVGHRLA